MYIVMFNYRTDNKGMPLETGLGDVDCGSFLAILKGSLTGKESKIEASEIVASNVTAMVPPSELAVRGRRNIQVNPTKDGQVGGQGVFVELASAINYIDRVWPHKDLSTLRSKAKQYMLKEIEEQLCKKQATDPG